MNARNVGWRRGLLGMVVFALALGAAQASQGDGMDASAAGLVVVRSAHDIDETQARLERAIEEKGLMMVAVVDHSANAANAGLELRPTRLFIFGNPKAGTPLMQAVPTVGIDLPQKILIWQAEDGTVYLAYNDPLYLAARHGLSGVDEQLEAVTQALAGLAEAATAP